MMCDCGLRSRSTTKTTKTNTTNPIDHLEPHQQLASADGLLFLLAFPDSEPRLAPVARVCLVEDALTSNLKKNEGKSMCFDVRASNCASPLHRCRRGLVPAPPRRCCPGGAAALSMRFCFGVPVPLLWQPGASTAASCRRRRGLLAPSLRRCGVRGRRRSNAAPAASRRRRCSVFFAAVYCLSAIAAALLIR